MIHEHEHKQGGCCGGGKHASNPQPVKEKDDCCDDENSKKPEADKTEKPQTQASGCCGGKK